MLKDRNRPSPGEEVRTSMMTPREAAQYLGLHLITIYRLIKKGKLPAFRVGGQWRFKKDLLDNWILEDIEKHKNTT